jgi:hypothetical protein
MSRPRKTSSLTLRISPVELARLEAMAKADDRTVASFVRAVLYREYLRRGDRALAPAKVRAAALAIDAEGTRVRALAIDAEGTAMTQELARLVRGS